MLVNQLTIAWDSWYLDSWIREGELNFRLARPIHPAHEAVAENIAYKARTAGMILVVWLIVAAAWPAVRLPFGAGRWGVTAVAVLLAAALRFFISFATGLLAFWTTRATAIMELHAGISLFLSGRLAPRSEEHTSELQSRSDLVCRLLLEKKKKKNINKLSLDSITCVE